MRITGTLLLWAILGKQGCPSVYRSLNVNITDIDDNGNLKEDEIVSPSSIEEKYFLNKDDLLFARSGSVGRTYLHKSDYGKFQFAGYLIRFKLDTNKALPEYVYYITKSVSFKNWIELMRKQGTLSNINAREFSSYKFPLPPLEVQQEIIAELESYQKIIDGAKQVVENYKPSIKIDPNWEMIKIDSICNLVRGSSPRPKGDPRYYGGKVPRLMISDVTRDGMYTTPATDFLTQEGAELSRPMKKGEVIMAVSGNPGLPTILRTDACIHDGFVGFRNLDTRVIPEFLYYLFLYYKEANNSHSIGAVFKNLTTDQIKEFEIPLPSLEVQQQILEQLAEERKLINTNDRLIEIFEQKIKDKIAEVWGDELHKEQGQNASSNGTTKQPQPVQQVEVKQAGLGLG